MAAAIRLLIVEDDEADQQTWSHLIETHNVNDDKKFALQQTQVKSLEEARRCIEDQDFDAAVVDLRLARDESGSGPNDDGNKVLELLLASEMAVAAVLSGEVGILDRGKFKNRVKEFTKGAGEDEGHRAVMKWLSGQADMISQIRSAATKMKQEMAKVFANSIWPRWEFWLGDENVKDKAGIVSAVTRHITSHVYAALLNQSAQKVHSEEWYFVPPIRDLMTTGDIIYLNEAYEVIVSPRCDMANDKTVMLYLAKCETFPEKYAELKKKKVSNPKSRELGNFIEHDGSKPGVHFLPQMRINRAVVGPFLVQFTNMRSIPMVDAHVLKDKRIASIAPEFLPSLVERLGAYFSRIGTPNNMDRDTS